VASNNSEEQPKRLSTESSKHAHSNQTLTIDGSESNSPTPNSPHRSDDMSQENTLNVPILSDILGGPIERGKVLVGLYEPSSQWLSFCLTIASGLVRRDHVVAVTTLTTPTSQIRQQLAKVLPNLQELEAAKRFTIIDWYTWMTGHKSAEGRSVDSLGLAQFNVQDSKFQRDDSPRYDFNLADNLSTFMKYNDERSFMQWFDKTIARMREARGIRAYGFVKHFHSESFYANLEAMADGIVELDNRHMEGSLENIVRLKNMKGLLHPTDWRVLRMTKSGLLQFSLEKKNDRK